MANKAARRAVLTGAGITPSLTVADGAAANTNITVAGLEKRDVLFGVINLTDQEDITADCSITAAGVIRCTGTTATDKLLVFFGKVGHP